MNKKASRSVKKESQASVKPLARDDRGFIVELPKPNSTQLIKKGLWPFKK
jgi:hypothetical protein